MAHSDKDLIDFPCSPTWASYYASQGLTADYPAAFYGRRAEPPARAPEPDSLRQTEMGLLLGRLTELTDLVSGQAGLIDALLLELGDLRARLAQQEPARPRPAKVVPLRPTAKPVEQVKAPPLAATPPAPPAPPAPRPRPILRGIDL